MNQSSLFVPPRQDQPELLDLGRGSPTDTAANLAEMWRINRDLGGFRALTLHLYPRLIAVKDPVTIADLGSGSADIPLALVRWARTRGLKLRVFALDWAERCLAVARTRVGGAPEISLLQADAGHLPFENVDFIISSLFLHHFSPESVIQMLTLALAHARRGIIMSDLIRGWLPYFAFKLIQPVFARNALTRHDGALSIRRAYTPTELLEFALKAGLPNPKVYTHWPWRMTLVADK
jgi:2-polyprenyl-3-methyl-5-hydroxy-6-metoxy-1,4-benzoquinol methylase